MKGGWVPFVGMKKRVRAKGCDVENRCPTISAELESWWKAE
jgi:hypothetical protein